MKKQILLAWILLLLAALACNLPFGGGKDTVGLPDAEAETFSIVIEDETVLEPVPLSAAQRQILTTKGSPNRFSIMFPDEIREETWYYDHLGYEVTFRNGEIFTEGTIEAVNASGFVSVYYPWQFNGEMGLSELLSVSESESFGVESLEEVFEEDVSLVYLTGLDAGFRGDRLLYVRAVPLGDGARDLAIMVEEVEATESEESSVDLSTAEAVHAGTHSYDMYCLYSDETSEEETDQITWTFTDEGVYFDGDGPYPKVNEDYYGIQDEYSEFFILFKENVVTITGEFLQEDEAGNQSSVTFTCALTQE